MQKTEREKLSTCAAGVESVIETVLTTFSQKKTSIFILDKCTLCFPTVLRSRVVSRCRMAATPTRHGHLFLPAGYGDAISHRGNLPSSRLSRNFPRDGFLCEKDPAFTAQETRDTHARSERHLFTGSTRSRRARVHERTRCNVASRHSAQCCCRTSAPFSHLRVTAIPRFGAT